MTSALNVTPRIEQEVFTGAVGSTMAALPALLFSQVPFSQQARLLACVCWLALLMVVGMFMMQ
jgi:hypothetical protein